MSMNCSDGLSAIALQLQRKSHKLRNTLIL